MSGVTGMGAGAHPGCASDPLRSASMGWLPMGVGKKSRHLSHLRSRPEKKAPGSNPEVREVAINGLIDPGSFRKD